MDILFIIGLPRSGTSLVHKLVFDATDRKAPIFEDFGISLNRVPRKVIELNKCIENPPERRRLPLAEDNDFHGYYRDEQGFRDYREWLQLRSDRWVLKSPEHIANLPLLFNVFPEAHYLWCLRPAGPTLSSIREYWQVAGVGPYYQILPTVDSALHYVRAFPERFDCIFTPSIPEWESDRDDPIESPEAFQLEIMLQQVKGACRNVTSNRFKELYS